MSKYRENLVKAYRTIQLSGVTNMFDRTAVQYYAYKVGLYNLVAVTDNALEYANFLRSLDAELLEVEPYQDKLEKLEEYK